MPLTNRSTIGMVLIGYFTMTTIMLTNDFFFHSQHQINPLTDLEQSNKLKDISTVEKSNKAEDSITNDQLSNPSVSKSSAAIDYNLDDFPFQPSNNYELYPNDSFDITLITYTSSDSYSYISDYSTAWKGPIVIVVYYTEQSLSSFTQFKEHVASLSNIILVPYLQEKEDIPVNHLKNLGIQSIQTTHFIFAEFGMLPSDHLYELLKATPGYLWRDANFVGVIPVYEWSHDAYPDAKESYQNFKTYPKTKRNLKKCLSSYHCRPLQTTTVPLQFRTFSFTTFRNMNCIDKDTELFMMQRKIENKSYFSESITERGYDNIEYVERLRYSAAKFGMLADGFLFRISGIGTSSDTVFSNLKKESLYQQYEKLRLDIHDRNKYTNPTSLCEEVEPSMYSWIGFDRYVWLNEKKDKDKDKLYPRIAYKKGNH